jgi:hypothetical protein
MQCRALASGHIMKIDWIIRRTSNGSFSLGPAGEQRALHAANETELRRQLAANSTVDECAQSVFDQLEKGDTAHIAVPHRAKLPHRPRNTYYDPSSDN